MRDRDSIFRTDFSKELIQGLTRFCEDHEGWDDMVRSIAPESWAWLCYRLKAAEDNPDWFPKGKSATIQRIEDLLYECASNANK